MDWSDPADAVRPARAWSPRAWRLAALLAALLFAVLLWGGRQAPAPSPAEASIAILPFASLSSDRDDDYFAEGLAVEMHDALAGVEGLKVAAQMSPAAAARLDADVKSLGALLGVAAVLDASVRREGQRVRINARLSDTSTGYTLWSRSYDRELYDVFAIQSEIANEVVRSLVGMIPGQREAIEKRLTPTRNVMAFDAYLHGLQSLLSSGSKQDDAVAYFGQALAEDAAFARAQAGICRAEVLKFLDHHDSDAYERADSACRRANEMEPGLGEVMVALADLHLARGESGKAIEHYMKAESDPARKADAYVGLARAHANMGRTERSWEYFDRALALSPDNAYVHSNIAYRHYLAGDFAAAIAAYERAVELRPDDSLLWSYLGALNLIAGRLEEAAQALSSSIGIEPTASALINLAELRYFERDYAGAVELLHEAIRLDASDYLTWGNLGQALLAVQGGATHAQDAFAQAARLAERYQEVRPEDAKVSAALAWYRVNLGRDDASVRELMRRSTELGGEPAEVALFNAQTLTALGALDAARAEVQRARTHGMAEYRIGNNASLGELKSAYAGEDGGEAPSTRFTP